MQSRRGCAVSYVKVEVRSRSPRLWGWSLHRDGSDNLLQRAEVAYGCAEAAWEAGRAAHRAFEATAAAAALARALAAQEAQEALAA